MRDARPVPDGALGRDGNAGRGLGFVGGEDVDLGHQNNRSPSAADVATGPRYWPAALLNTRSKDFLKQINLSFFWDNCCHLTMCLHVIVPN